MNTRTITLKPNKNGDFQAYTRMAVSGEMAVSKPFPPVLIETEKRHWADHGFKVVIAQSRFAKVE